MQPTLKDYTNWPSKEAIVNNILNFRTAKKCVDRLSPRLSEMSTTGSFFNRRKGSYFKANEGAPRLMPDPIAVAVDMNRLKDRAKSTLRATPTQLQVEGNEQYYRSLFLHKGDGMGQNFFKTSPRSIGRGRNNMSGF